MARPAGCYGSPDHVASAESVRRHDMTDQEVQFAYILLVGLILVWLWARDID